MLAGASPRGMSLMMRAARVAAWLDARDHVTPEDCKPYSARRWRTAWCSSRSTRCAVTTSRRS